MYGLFFFSFPWSILLEDYLFSSVISFVTLLCFYRFSLELQLTLEQCGDYGCQLPRNRKSVYNFWLPQNLTIVIPWYPQGSVSRNPVDTQIHDTQVPFIKWHRTVYIYSQTLVEPTVAKLGIRGLTVYCKKSACKWPTQFKSVLFTGQLYFVFLNSWKFNSCILNISWFLKCIN